MRIAAITESDSLESRVSVTPETIKKLIGLGGHVTVQAGAGLKSGITDADYTAAGAVVVPKVKDALKDAEVVLKVRRPNAAELAVLKPGTLVLAIMDPYGNGRGAQGAWPTPASSAFAMELMPRITRAQVMDVLSSPGQPRRLPRRDRRRGRIWPRAADDDDGGRHGAGRAQSSSWASASPACRPSPRRAASARSSPRPTCGRPPRSRSNRSARNSSPSRTRSSSRPQTAGGYAKEMSKEYQAKQAALVASHIAKQDIVITTALIPGRPAPKLVSRGDGRVDAPGLGASSILRSSAAATCEGAKPGEVVTTANGVKIVGHLNVRRPPRGDLPRRSTPRTSINFLETMIDKPTKALAVNWDDELVKATNLTRDGAVVHPNFQPKAPSRQRKRRSHGERTPQQLSTRPRPPRARTQAAEPPELRRPARRTAARQCMRHRRGDRPLRVPARDLRAGGLRRLLRRVVGDAGAAYAADVGDQRHLLGDRGRRAARGRRRATAVDDGAVWARGFGFIALMLASVNIFGGFLVTQRMLAMYKKKG